MTPQFTCPFSLCHVAASAEEDVALAVAKALLHLLAASLGTATAWALDNLIRVINSTTAIDLQAGWFVHRADAMFTLMALLLVPLLMAGTISAIIHQDLQRLGRTWLVGLPVSLLGTVFAVALTQLAVGVGDAMCHVISAGVGFGPLRSVAGLAESPATPGVITVFFDVTLLLGAVLIWLELIIRSAAVYVAVFFLPLALAGLLWPATAHLPRRLLEMLATLILSKFVIVATLTLGVGALTDVHGVDQVVAGIAILLIAAFAPYVLFRMVPIVEAASTAHLQGLAQSGMRAVRQAANQAGGGTDVAGSALQSLRSRLNPPTADDVEATPMAQRGPTYDPNTGDVPKAS